MIVVHGETLWSPSPQPMDDDDDVTPGVDVDSYSCHFGAINKEQSGDQNLGWYVFYWYLLTLMENLMSIVNPGIWMTVGNDSIQYRKRKKTNAS